MGLADLKKSSTQSDSSSKSNTRKLQMSLDEFINDATTYAAGHTADGKSMADVIELASRFSVPESKPLIKAINHGVIRPIKTFTRDTVPYRKATFTLSESAISRLAELASGCDVAKSKLIRFLIEHHFSLDETERKEKEKSIIVN